MKFCQDRFEHIFLYDFYKSWFYDLALKMIWNLLDIQRSGSVKFHEDWMCLDSPFVFYK